jgi:MarR family transcriptional regulator, negative regulator of the multidrug operon emrRAB
MHDETARTANLLGATALAVTDLALSGAARSAGVSDSGAAALVVLSASPGLSVTELGRRVGLTQSAAARMVDALESDGLVERRPGLGRFVTVRLTDAGDRTVRGVLAARGGPLTDLVATLDAHDRERLDTLLSHLLTQLYGTVGSTERMCRLCDRDACTTDATCPVGAAGEAAGEAVPDAVDDTARDAPGDGTGRGADR